MGEPIRSPVEATAFVHASLDGAGLIEGDTFVTVNEELAETFGFDNSTSLIGKSWEALYPPLECKRIKQDVLPRIRDRTGWRGEVEGKRADGTPFQQVLSVRGDGNGKLIWVVRNLGPNDFDIKPGNGATLPVGGPAKNGHKHSNSTNYNESNRDGNGTAERNEMGDSIDPGRHFRPLFEKAPVPIVVFTPERGIVYGNRAAAELVAVDKQGDLLGRQPAEFVHPEDRCRARKRIRGVIENRQATEPTEYRLLGREGRKRFAEIATAPVTYDDENAAYVIINDITRYRRAQNGLRRERRFIENVIDAIDDVVYVLNEDGEAHLWNDALENRTGYTHEEIASMPVQEFIPADQHEYVPGLLQAIHSLEDQRVELDLLTKNGERIPHEFRGTTFEDPETGTVFRCGVARDITDRLERQRRLEHQRDELATLERINRVLLETTHELIRTADREAIERTVCTQLSASDFYEFTWIAERKIDEDGLEMRTSAGDDRGYFEEITSGTDVTEIEGGPVDRALHTGEVQVVDLDRSGRDSWMDAAREYDFRSVAAVPLHHEGTDYGVLIIQSLRPNAFSPREQDGFEVLGRTVGFSINAVRNHKLLFTDTVVELEFRIRDDTSVFGTIAANLDCEIELAGYVAVEKQWLLYLDTNSEPPMDLVTSMTEVPVVNGARVLSSGSGDGHIELTVSAPSLMHVISHVGASVETAVADTNETRIVVEAPVDISVRDIVTQIQADQPDAELLAQRNPDHDVSKLNHPNVILGKITDRQRQVLETAFRAGYFAWPRESTASEVAESLDLAAPTLHGHLRKAEKLIFSTLFDG